MKRFVVNKTNFTNKGLLKESKNRLNMELFAALEAGSVYCRIALWLLVSVIGYYSEWNLYSGDTLGTKGHVV